MANGQVLVTRATFPDAEFLPGGEGQHAGARTGLAQVGERFLRDGASDCPRGQVKDLVQFSFGQRLQRREDHGDRLTYAGRRLDEQASAVSERLIDCRRKFPLTGPIARKREGDRSD